ncbi:MAG: hypothetical protein HOH95_06060 [Dehalococcoidia bacterium]|jgi:hypothetical protein|nr:hypothetical protein [Dehalococcoidia bacterium]
MSVITNRLLLVLGIALASVAVACSSSDADVAANGTTTTSTSDSTTTSTTGTDATSNQPAWVTDALDQQETTRYIANSGGVGVSHRSACEDASRIDGVWPEGAELQIVLADEPDCAEWTLLSDGTVTSWVRNKYLASAAPATAGGTASTGSSSTGSSSSTVQIEVIDFFGNLIPTSLLRVRPLSYTYNNAVFVSGCDKSWHPIGDSAIALSGKVIADPDPNNCGFGVVSLVPAYWVTVNR